MEIVERVKSILVSPKTEWQTIEAENTHHAKVFTTYVVLPAIASVTMSVMVNAHYLFPVADKITVYPLAGLGILKSF
jgi:hypothetical protein